MKSKTWSLLACFVVMCSLGGALSGCTGADEPPPAKPKEAPPATTEKDKQPHTTKTGKAYGSNDLYKKSMRKPDTQ
jgi:hypothetical protein